MECTMEKWYGDVSAPMEYHGSLVWKPVNTLVEYHEESVTVDTLIECHEELVELSAHS